ncbi:MAG: hypothetical protein ACQEQM_00355 [Thermoplasmatota archaeon]
MKSELSLNYKDKVLLFLRDHIGLDEETDLPEDVTQKGISENIGMSRTHASRLLKELREKGFLNEDLCSVEGHERKLKTYRLTSKGFKKSEKLYEDFMEKKVPIVYKEGKKSMKISNVLDRYEKNPTLLEMIRILENEELPLNIYDTEETITFLEDAPDFEEMINRKRELEELERWFESDIPVAVILGRRGYGCSTLARSFIEGKNRHVLWIKVAKKPLERIKKQIVFFLKELGAEENKNIIKKLCRKNVLVVLDDYYEVDDDLVDFLDEYIKISGRDVKSKLLVTSRKGIPVYERFYKIQDVNNDDVREIDISPLDKYDAQELLGTHLKKEALDRLMLMTKGSPLLLKLLKVEDRKKLHEVSPLSKEQISLLIFLKSEELKQ